MQIEKLTQRYDVNDILQYLNQSNLNITMYHSFHLFLTQNILPLSNQNISYVLKHITNQSVKNMITMYFYKFNDICLDQNIHYFNWNCIPKIFPNKSILNTDMFWIKFVHYINSDRCYRNRTYM